MQWLMLTLHTTLTDKKTKKNMEQRVVSLDEYIKKNTPVGYEEYVEKTDPSVDEKSVSVAQQRLFGMAWAVRSGAMKRDDASAEVLSIVDSDMTDKQIKDFAETSHTGLPKHKTEESVDVNESGTITIGNKIADDLKNFLMNTVIPKSGGYVRNERDAAALLFDIIKHRYNF